MPKARPILMSAPMVLAVLEGRKTQTRRKIKVTDNCTYLGPVTEGDEKRFTCAHFLDAGVYRFIDCPYGKAGDLLWVRESWQGYIEVSYEYDDWRVAEKQDYSDGYNVSIEYRATSQSIPDRWRPSIHMPRKYSRLTLEIINIRLERLRDISDADKLSEGAQPDMPFGTIWKKINGEESWNSNPWVWVIEFKVHKKNIDEVLRGLSH